MARVLALLALLVAPVRYGAESVTVTVLGVGSGRPWRPTLEIPVEARIEMDDLA